MRESPSLTHMHTFSQTFLSSLSSRSGVSIKLEPNKRIALVGRSGSGKSSVVALLQRLYDPVGGSLKLDGVDIRELDMNWFRSHIGVVRVKARGGHKRAFRL